MATKLINNLKNCTLPIMIYLKSFCVVIFLLSEISYVYANVDYTDVNLIIMQNKEVERSYKKIKQLQHEHSQMEGRLEISKAELEQLAQEVKKISAYYDKLWVLGKDGNAIILKKVNEAAKKKRLANDLFNNKRIEVGEISGQVIENKLTIANVISENKKARSKEQITFEHVVTQKLAIELAKIEKPNFVKLSITDICSRTETLISCETRVRQLAEQKAIAQGARKTVKTMTEIRNFQLKEENIINSLNAKLSNEIILKSRLVKASPLTYEVELSVNVAPVRNRFIKAEVRKAIIHELLVYRFKGDSL